MLGSAMLLAVLSATALSATPRLVKISGQEFVLSSTNETVVLAGPNVVVKGPPYLPAVSGVPELSRAGI